MLNKIPLKHVLVAPFLGLIFLSVALVGYASLHNGRQAVNQVVNTLRNEIDSRIVDHLNRFLALPHQINQTNAAVMEKGLIDAADQKGLARYFQEQIRIFDSVTSINFSNTRGGLVNAGREGFQGDLYVIMTDDFRSGTFRKFALDRDGTPGTLLNTLAGFDGRIRPWYIRSVKEKGPVWSDAYVLFTGQDLSVCAGLPVYDDQDRLLGVLAVDLFLSHLSDFLSQLNVGESGQSFILERSGLLIASSTGEKPLIHANGTGIPRRIDARKSASPLTRMAARTLAETCDGYLNIQNHGQFEFTLDHQRQFATFTPFKDPHGLDWVIVTVIPEKDFMGHISKNNRATLLVMMITLIIAAGISLFIAYRITRPVSDLNTAVSEISRGKWDQHVGYRGRISEIRALTEAFNDMAGQLEHMFTGLKSAEARIRQLEKAESLDRMAEAVAHHYNNQLSVVMGNLELALIQMDEENQADQIQVLENAMKATRRAARMGDEMLSLLGNKTVRCQRLDMVEICRNFLAGFQARLPEGMSLQVHLPESSLWVMANAEQMETLLDNLLQNACEAMEEKTGRIEVEIRMANPGDISQKHRWPVTFTPNADRYVRVSVTDQGDGIEAVQLEKIFDPFFSTRFIGRGLGLPLSLSIVKSHNGCIVLESIPGNGSTFHIFLPEAA